MDATLLADPVARAATYLPVRPVLSRDGRFVAWAEPDYKVIVANLSTGVQARATPLGKADFWPSFSPDGSRLMLVRDGQVVTMAVDGTDIEAVLTGSVRAPEWSPDGQWLVWVDASTEQLEIMRLDGSGRRTIAAPVAGSIYTDPTWSPTGDRLAFVRADYATSETTSGAIIVTNLQTNLSVELPLANGRGAERPTWSPDGRRLAFCVPVGSPLVLRTMIRRQIQLWTVASGAVRSIGDIESSDCSPTWSRISSPETSE